MKYVYQTPSKTFRATMAASLFAGTLAVYGCAGPSLFSRNAHADDSGQSIDKVMGPTERNLRQVAYESDERVRGGSDKDMELARSQYERAAALYDGQNYVAAEKAFKKIVDQRRKSYETFQTRFENALGLGTSSLAYDRFGDPIEEDALFMLGESQFALQKYTKAQDSYDDLLNRYPSTRHMDRVTRQLFRMARYWLDFPMDAPASDSSEIQLASSEEGTPPNPTPEPRKQVWGASVLPNLTDKTRPVYDADGRGLQALRSIWLHDATGPLADDALMLSANHNLRVRNYVEAKRLYSLLREQYPDSPHLKDAYLLGSHVTLASYEGAAYDGNALHEARDLKQTLIQLYPDLNKEERQLLESEIDAMHDAEIERIWEKVRFYQIKGTKPSIALYCNMIINRYPNSEYAARAREILRDMEPSKPSSSSSIWPWSSQPATRAVPSSPPNPAMSPQMQTAPQGLPGDEANPEKRSLLNFLRKADEAPQLESPPAGSNAGRSTL